MSGAHFLAPFLKREAPKPILAIDPSSSPLATTVELALDSAARKRGLLGRDGLAPGHALVIAPCNGVHTFGMRFAIDVIFAARDGRVVKIAHAVPARRIAFALGAFAAIEMAAGEADRAGLRVGDRLTIRDRV